jgi:5-(carboxyamino)imidazole ribonucleotide mutase
MLASITPLPVIGVPIPLKALDGMDSLLSIVQMPAGIPVATVGIGNAKNAGLLAARILGAHNSSALKAITEQMAKMHTDVLGRAENLKRTSQGE